MSEQNKTECEFKLTDLDFSLLLASTIILVLYNVFYVLQVWRRPHQTNVGLNLEVRKRWARHLMMEGNASILGVQAVRNVIMSATFFATATVTIAYFVAGSASNQCGLRRIQGYILTLTLVWSFVHWMISIKVKTLHL
eukprot:TRINITY_DN7212_c0_g1_i2.p1 TRINITY_DN7212_c0_g1~~TRINITY_DN7212_c0_g1_i2.p1  ORF type:complete len:138 (-),score=16.57 TRINITY_DN7212_c0_g1_i2:927-1340(-)